MAAEFYKILLFMKRRPGLSTEAFRAYYENSHAPLCEKYATNVDRYVRRYIAPLPHPETGPADELPFDVITELWFADEALFNSTVAYLTTSKMPDEIIADEMKLFDRTSFRLATVVEHESSSSTHARNMISSDAAAPKE